MRRRTRQLLVGTSRVLCQICVGDYGKSEGIKLVVPFSTDQLSKLEKEEKAKRVIERLCQTCIFGGERHSRQMFA